MRFKQLTILLGILLLATPFASAQTQMYLDHVEGLTPENTLTADGATPIIFHIGMNNSTGQNIKGWTTGFRIYTTSGAEWGVSVTNPDSIGYYTGAITTGMAEQSFVNQFSVDGMGADTVGFGGFSLFAPGIPDEFNDIVWTIEIGPISDIYNGGEICLDTSFYPPAGAWTWSLVVGSTDPTWDGDSENGGHCFLIGVAGDAPPEFPQIAAQFSPECVEYSLDLFATDPQSDPNLIISVVSGDPIGSNFVDNGDGSATFTYTPANGEAVTEYNILFSALSPLSGLSTEMTVSLTIIPNEAPFLTYDGGTTAKECEPITFTVTGDDAEGAPVTLNELSLPPGAFFNPITGIFTWTPTSGQAGTHFATFNGTDDCGNTSNTLTVPLIISEDEAPIIITSATQTVIECAELSFGVSASDAESGVLTVNHNGLPGGATFENGLFLWTPIKGDAGEHIIIFTATDDCLNTTDFTVTITVEANQAPTLSVEGSTTTTECERIDFTITSFDPEGEEVTLGHQGLPAGASFDEVTGEFSWLTGPGTAGTQDVTFEGTDNCFNTVTEIVTITINTNQDPTISVSGLAPVIECQEIQFNVSSIDPEGGEVTLTDLGLPSGATFVGGLFTWTPGAGTVGTQDVTFNSTDDCNNSVNEVVTITINANQPPTLAFQGTTSGIECQLIEFTIVATDPESEDVTLGHLALPTGATFNNGVFSWTPNSGDAALYNITFTGDDPCGNSTNLVVAVNVTANAAPTLSVVGSITGAECSLIEFTIVPFDPEGGIVTLGHEGLPTGASYNEATGEFSWETSNGDLGNHPITFTGLDDCDNAVTEAVTVVVTANAAPSITVSGLAPVIECQEITLNIAATDPENGPITLGHLGLPGNAEFVNGLFTWTPASGTAGTQDVSFTAEDDCGNSVTEVVTITITANQEPTIAVNGVLDVTECKEISLNVVGTDPEGETITYGHTGLPTGATFVDGLFTWTPDKGTTNTDVTFNVTDECSNVVSSTVTITVNINTPPTLEVSGTTTVTECELMTFTVTGNDVDGDNVTLSHQGIPAGATFEAGEFNWTPPVGTASSIDIVFEGDDGCNDVTKTITTLTVPLTINANQAPDFVVIDPITAAECELVEFTISASDPEGVLITKYGHNGLPSEAANFDPDTKIFSWPLVLGDSDNSPYAVEFTATDECGVVATMEVTITVTADIAPVLTIAPASDTAQETTQGIAVGFTFSAIDAGGDTDLEFELVNASPNATFSDPVNNTANFSWKPNNQEAGVDSLWVKVTDACGSTDSQLVVITVLENSKPVFGDDLPEPPSIQQGGLIEYRITASDEDFAPAGKVAPSTALGNTVLTLWADTDIIPATEVFKFTDSGNGVGGFEWITTENTVADDYEILFFASDDVDTTEISVIFGIATSVEVVDGAGLPEDFYLSQNYPNPFNPETQIEFGVSEKSHVTLAVYNVLGQRIKILVDEVMSPNTYTAFWDGSSDIGLRVASGIYFYKLEAGKYSETKKMIMLK